MRTDGLRENVFTKSRRGCQRLGYLFMKLQNRRRVTKTKKSYTGKMTFQAVLKGGKL